MHHRFKTSSNRPSSGLKELQQIPVLQVATSANRFSRLAKSPDEHLAHCILGADVPSDQCVTGTMITLKASGESWNCGFSIGGARGRSAPHVEPCARGK